MPCENTYTFFPPDHFHLDSANGPGSTQQFTVTGDHAETQADGVTSRLEKA